MIYVYTARDGMMEEEMVLEIGQVIISVSAPKAVSVRTIRGNYD